MDKSLSVDTWGIHDETFIKVTDLGLSGDDNMDSSSSSTVTIKDQIKYLITDIHDKQELIIRRDHIVEDSLEQFSDVTPLKKIFVKFEHEKGYDGDGLTRGFFSDFWEEFLNIYGSGDSYVYLKTNPSNVLKRRQYEAIGSIFIHGLVLCGYLPLKLNKAVLYYLITGKYPNDDLIEVEFLKCLTQNEQDKISEMKSSLIRYDESTKF